MKYRETTSRSELPDKFPITERDLGSLEYDLSKVAIFYPEPLTIEIPEWDNKTIRIGSGYGGLSWSLFQRGEGCTACGLCCHNTFRRVWFWMPDQPKPRGLPEFEIYVNGIKRVLPYHMQKGGEDGERCDYLEPLLRDGVQVTEKNDLPIWLCSLHREDESPFAQQNGPFEHRGDLKPVHCRMSPFVAIHNVNTVSGTRQVLSRRLPSRNWRWPKCPIPVYDLPISKEIVDNDARNFEMLYQAYGDLPGSKMYEGLSLWRDLADQSLAGSPPTETIYLEDQEWA